MQLTHATDYQLAGFFVVAIRERWVFLGKDAKGGTQLVPVTECIRFDGHRDDGDGEVHLFQKDLGSFTADGIPGSSFLEADDHPDIACFELTQLFRSVCMHTKDAIDPFTFLLGDVHQRSALSDGAVVHPDEVHRSGFTVDLDLENEGQRRLILGIGDFNRFFSLKVDSIDGRDFGRRGQVVHNSIQQCLHSDVFERGTDENWQGLPLNGRLLDGFLDKVDANRLS
ncbi:hypothetical protein SDC9_66697 [bioreactor metagenome]|uniref:Uncharacterized protein n=1 Tax=bioreactor metagenome TaxID=1076179 RepID=A0A644XWV1_9ZZZZ